MENNYNNINNNNKSGKEDRIGHLGIPPVHSQVRKIKQESKKIIIDWSLEQPEVRPVLREITRQLSPSPLGLAGRPISVGDS